MQLKVISTASSKKQNIFVNTMKVGGVTPATGEILFCSTIDLKEENEMLKLKIDQLKDQIEAMSDAYDK
jgi:hypothetical protein